MISWTDKGPFLARTDENLDAVVDSIKIARSSYDRRTIEKNIARRIIREGENVKTIEANVANEFLVQKQIPTFRRNDRISDTSSGLFRSRN